MALIFMPPNGLMCNFRRGVNLLDESQNLASATIWNNGVAGCTFVASSDPWGGTNGFAVVALGAGSAWQTLSHIGKVFDVDVATLSFYVKGFAGSPQNNPYFTVRFVTSPGSVVYSQQFTVDNVSAVISTAGSRTCDAGEAIDVGGGWYRCYATLNVGTRSLRSTTLIPRMECFNSNLGPPAGRMMLVAGAQLNPGSLPTTYVKKVAA